MATTFCPNGLQAIKTVTSASYSGQTQSFMLGNYTAEGVYVPTAESIFFGDPVGLWNGALTNVNGNPNANPPVPSAAAFTPCGVFVSCSYESAPNTSTGYNTSSAGNPMYTGGTTNNTGGPVMGQIISDPNVVYTIQVAGANGQALSPANVKALVNCAGGVGQVSLNKGGTATGNLSTGASVAFLNYTNITLPGAAVVARVNGLAPVRILGLSQNVGLNTSADDPFPFVDVMLLGHLFQQPYPAGAPQLGEEAKGVSEEAKVTKGNK